ncbi:MAG: hypothetical protein RSB38_05970 [Oscillospiraceae bacterium]
MKKKVIIAVILAVTTAFMFGGCGRKKAKTAEVNSTQTPTPTVTATNESQIVGKWTIENLVDKDGNIIDLEKLNGDDSNLKMLGTVLKSGTMIEFFDTGKVKLSVISADYSFSDDKNISIKSSLIKTPLNLKVNIENNAMTLNSEQGFTVNLKK